MVFFGKKGDDSKGGEAPIEYSPEKAEKFFKHARTTHEATNYEYAMQLWLSGLRFHPGSMDAIKGFLESASGFLEETGGKKGVSKEVLKAASGKTDVERFLMCLLEWGLKIRDLGLAVKATEAASKIGQTTVTTYIADYSMGLMAREPKIKKEHYLKLMESLQKVGAADKALQCAEQAQKADPTNGELAATIRSLAAQATMTRGGFDATGEAGGFRRNIRDADKQRQLEEADRIVKTEETIDRLIATGKADMEARPGDLPTLEKYCKLLLERAKPADEAEVIRIYLKAHQDFKQYRFREMAGDVRIRQERRKVTELKVMLEQAGDDEMIRRMHDQQVEDLNKLEVQEFKERVENYPSDLTKKFELGRRLFAIGDWDGTISMMQEAQSDPKNRVVSLTMLGQAFVKIDYIDEAVETFRKALESRDLAPELQLELRYHLLTALQIRAETSRELATAEEAEKIAASIAAQQFGYRDIRTRRDAIKKLVTELRAGKSQG
ncbi:MAG: tetratricopeptide repeat protein [Phycisphaerales bacterium]